MYEELLQIVQQEFPALRIVQKSDSVFMRFLSFCLLLVTLGKMRSFMDVFVTTVGDTIYVPTQWGAMSDTDRCGVLRHERVHLRQQRKYGKLLFGFLYLVPILPVGLAYFRAKFEKEAYEESLRFYKDAYGMQSLYNRKLKDSIVNHFVTAEYGWMWPFKKQINTWYDDCVEKLNA